MNWKARLLYPQNWNIGFVEQSVENLIVSKKIGCIRWMKHKYKDRWFADPFIYNVTDKEIVVFVEECPISDTPKGILCELHVDRKTMHLLERYVLLELDTHLSYPAFIQKDGVTYVYPENGASGKLNIYEYDKSNHRLINPVCILDEAVADSTILVENGKFYLIATKAENPLEEAFLYSSDNIKGEYKMMSMQPVQARRTCSRPAGNWIQESCNIYRPAQDCGERYGGGINMMRIDSLNPYVEVAAFSIRPVGHKYQLGIHTINSSTMADLLVVDGYGYLHPYLYRIWNFMSNIKRRFVRR